MRRICLGDAAGDRHAIVQGAADWLHLAAAPAFALMALLTNLSGGDVLCGAVSPLGGMVPMYLMMSAVHLPAWLKLITRAR